MSAWPATDRADALGPRRVLADRVVERERPVEDAALDLPAVRHLAQRRGVERRADVRVDGLHGREDRHLRHGDAEHVREVDRVAHDVGLLGQRRLDVDRGVGDQQDPVVGGHVHHEDVADAPLGAQPGLRGHDLRRATRRCAGCPSSASRPRPSRASAAAAAAEAWLCSVATMRMPARSALFACATARMRAGGPDQHRHDQPAAGRLERAEQRVAVARMRHRAGDGLERAALAQQAREHVVAPQDDLGGGDVGVGDRGCAAPRLPRCPRRRGARRRAHRIRTPHARSQGASRARSPRPPAPRRPAPGPSNRAVSRRSACPDPAGAARAARK